MRLPLVLFLATAINVEIYAFDPELLNRFRIGKTEHQKAYHLHVWEDQAKLDTCTVGGVPDDYTGRPEWRAHLFDCARSGGLKVEFVDFNATVELPSCPELEGNSRYDVDVNRIVTVFRNDSLDSHGFATAILEVRELDFLGYAWTLDGSGCSVSLAQELVLDANDVSIGLLGLKHDAILDAAEARRLTGETVFCNFESFDDLSQEQKTSIKLAMECSEIGFAIYQSEFFGRAVAVPLQDPTSPIRKRCGTALLPTQGFNVPSGSFGPDLQWQLSMANNDPLIVARVADSCAMSYSLYSGTFLGVRAPFRCEEVRREISNVELRYDKDTEDCSPEATESMRCLVECMKSGLYIDTLANDDTACYSARDVNEDEEDGCPYCSIGMSEYNLRSQRGAVFPTTSGAFDWLEFTAEGNITAQKINVYVPSPDGNASKSCYARFSVFKGVFLGVRASGRDFKWAARQTGIIINVFLGMGMILAMVQNTVHDEQFGSIFTFLYNVQFIGVASQIGGRELGEDRNGTTVTLQSYQPEAVQTLAYYTQWSNFKGWGLVNFGAECESLTGEYDLFDVVSNCILLLMCINAARLLIKNKGEGIRKKVASGLKSLGVSSDYTDYFEGEKDLAVFPQWEIAAMNAQIQGIGLAIGAAFGSKCAPYYNAAAIFLSCVAVALLGLTIKVYVEIYKEYPEEEEEEETKVSTGCCGLGKGKPNQPPTTSTTNGSGVSILRNKPKGKGGTVSSSIGFVGDDGFTGTGNEAPEAEEMHIKPQKKANFLETYFEMHSYEKVRKFLKWEHNHETDEGHMGRVSRKWAELKDLFERGEWLSESEAKNRRKKISSEHNRFMKGYGALFVDNMHNRWWYILAIHIRRLLEGIILGVTTGATNSGLVLGLNIVHVLLLLTFPKINTWQGYRELHSKCFDVARLLVAIAFVNGTINTNIYAETFVCLTWAGVVPDICNVVVALCSLPINKRHVLKKEDDDVEAEDNEDDDAGADIWENKHVAAAREAAEERAEEEAMAAMGAQNMDVQQRLRNGK